MNKKKYFNIMEIIFWKVYPRNNELANYIDWYLTSNYICLYFKEVK
jgi:hypothetical protein